MRAEGRNRCEEERLMSEDEMEQRCPSMFDINSSRSHDKKDAVQWSGTVLHMPVRSPEFEVLH